MKKRIIIGAFAVLAAIGLVFAFSGCDLFVTAMSGEAQPYGRVINAKSGGAVEAAKVTLTPITKEAPVDATEEQVEQLEKENQELQEQQEEAPESFYAITLSTGEFDWYSEEKTVPMGTYRLTVEVSGYISIPQTVNINAVYPDLGDLVVLPYNEDTDAWNVSFVLMWNNSFADVDGHLTFPTAVYTESQAAYDPYSEDTGSTGFSPNVVSGGDGTAEKRERIYYGNATTVDGDSYGTSGITYASTFDWDADADGTNDSFRTSLDVDDRDGTGPETITIRALPIPYDAGDYTNDYAGTTHTDLVNSYNYNWIGTMEYYVRAYSYAAAEDTTTEIVNDSYLSEVSDGYSADAVLYVFFGDTIIGIYTIPTYTEIKNASVVRINSFLSTSDNTNYYEEMILYPDIRIVNDNDYLTNGFRGIAPVNEVVRIRRPVR